MQIRFDRSESRFFADLDGGQARLYFTMAGPDVMNIVSTYVPPEARGQGIGEELVGAAIEYANDQGWDIAATCSFARKVLARPA